MGTDLIELSTPGEVFMEEFLDPMGITPYALAKSIFIGLHRITAILKGKRRITADTVVRFSKFCSNSAEFLMNMQTRYELEVLAERIDSNINKITRFNKTS